MKKQSILISLFAVACLVGCAGNGNGNGKGGKSGSSSAGGGEDADKSKLVINDYGTAVLEAENFKVDNWYADESYEDGPVIQESRASGGAYLAAPDKDAGSEAKFSFELKKDSRVVVYAAYAQMDSQKSQAIDMSKVYHYNIESVSPLSFASGKGTLKARSSATTWESMPYLYQDLDKGTYNVTLTIKDEAEACPSIDFLSFKTTAPEAAPADPGTVTEADIPDNDMRNLQQYKYLLDEDVYAYKTYANGNDLSAPRGMKLKFDDVETASKYYVQVAESETGLADAAVREATDKFYYFQNAKLATKYYYRAATSEAGLANAAVKNITSTGVAPRVVYVPDVLNFRDIGGWESSLVPGAKINQGLYFRCAQLDAAQGSTTSKLDSAGKGKAALKELGIKCDIDMRDKGNQPSNGVSAANSADWPFTFVSAAVPSGSEGVRWEGGTYQGTDIAKQYVTIFNAIANCDNEPALLHCTYGADRTGIVSFFLEALLGMNQVDMTRDYLWTQFTKGRNVKILEADGAEFPQWISKTQDCEGATFADKMENHLISFGIDKGTLEHIREIFIPGYVATAPYTPAA